jgi:GT2 family glycosyltransferase
MSVLPVDPPKLIELISEITMPLVSIVIPTYNHLDLLKACITSIKTYTDLVSCEVIIVANGCTDGTADYLKSLPAPFRSISFSQPLGYTKATNEGIKVATGKYVLLLNNDIILLPQPKNSWIEQLLAPFNRDKVGITGPVKFHWNCGDTERRAIAFWCAMIPRSLFDQLGLLDEIFSPGMGEDGDFSIKAEEAGYKLVQIPIDSSEEFGKGIPNQVFPVYHKGSGTFSDKDYTEVSKRNAQILRDRYGKKSKDALDEIFDQCSQHPCDVNQLFPLFRKYSKGLSHITEFGVRGVMTTWAFLASRPKRMISYDIEYEPFAANIEGAKNEARKAGIAFEFQKQDVLQADIEPTELLFIDTKHTYAQLKAELVRHAGKVSKYILMHDTESFGLKGEDGGPGELQAISEFLVDHPEWQIVEQTKISNGLVVLERKITHSIIIPTCGKNWKNVLNVCIEAARAYTNWDNKELIVVANGCPKGAIDDLIARRDCTTSPMRIIEFSEPIGYIRAVNAGIREARGKYVVLLDDDSFLLGQPKDLWITYMMEPFNEDPEMGATGPFGQTYDDLGQVLHSGCTMYRTDALQKVGLFDEAFNPGYMGDEDLAIRLRKAGYKLQEVPKGAPKEYVNGVFQIRFPVIHTGTVNTMPKHTTDLPLVEKNRNLLYERHGMSIGKGFGPPLMNCPVGTPGTPGVVGKPRISIVIPTYQHLEDLLKPCISSILEYTDMANNQTEVVVVANGCTDGTEDYVRSLGPNFKVVSFPDAMGYTKSTNEGIKVATGEHLIFFNNDNLLLPQPKNRWVEQLLAPFKDNPRMGITGPLQLHDDYADEDVIIGFCLCISKKVMDDTMADTGGLLDEIFSPGGGEDIDLCCKARRKGYIVRQVPSEGKLGFSHTNTGDFMIWHKNNQTFKDIEEYTRFYVKRNGFINMKRYNNNIKLNLGAGGIEYPGYLSVDLYDRRAVIIQDITKLDLNENSVSEMMAIHVLEHLSPYKVLETLKLWCKILKPGGKLVMEMPDVEQLCKRFVDASTGQRYGILNAVYGSVNTTDQGEPSDITSPHLFGWWPQSIADHLWNAGFVDIKFGPEQFPHPESNMHVEATKPFLK